MYLAGKIGVKVLRKLPLGYPKALWAYQIIEWLQARSNSVNGRLLNFLIQAAPE